MALKRSQATGVRRERFAGPGSCCQPDGTARCMASSGSRARVSPELDPVVPFRGFREVASQHCGRNRHLGGPRPASGARWGDVLACALPEGAGRRLGAHRERGAERRIPDRCVPAHPSSCEKDGLPGQAP